MKVLGIGGSPREGGNTDTLLARFIEGAANQGAEVKTLSACHLRIRLCPLRCLYEERHLQGQG